MRYPGDRHVLPLFGPWRWAPYMRGKFYWKKYQNARSFFLSHITKLNQQKQWDVVPKSTAKIDPSNKYNIFPSFIMTNHETPYNLKILFWASTHLLSQSLPYLHLQVCDHLGKIHFNIIMIGASEKMKLKSGHITFVQCIPFTTECGNLCQTSPDARKIGAMLACQLGNAIELRFAGGPIVARDWILAGFTLGSYIK